MFTSLAELIVKDKMCLLEKGHFKKIPEQLLIINFESIIVQVLFVCMYVGELNNMHSYTMEFCLATWDSFLRHDREIIRC